MDVLDLSLFHLIYYKLMNALLNSDKVNEYKHMIASVIIMVIEVIIYSVTRNHKQVSMFLIYWKLIINILVKCLHLRDWSYPWLFHFLPSLNECNIPLRTFEPSAEIIICVVTYIFFYTYFFFNKNNITW